jgi:hypothetical protein
MRLHEGLAGLVAEGVRPVAVQQVRNHPRFKYFREAGEDDDQSFLGVPLIDGAVLQGVLVVQTRDARMFCDNEIRMLVEAAAQVAPVVSEARTLDRFIAPTLNACGRWPGICGGAPIRIFVGKGQYLVPPHEIDAAATSHLTRRTKATTTSKGIVHMNDKNFETNTSDNAAHEQLTRRWELPSLDRIRTQAIMAAIVFARRDTTYDPMSSTYADEVKASVDIAADLLERIDRQERDYIARCSQDESGELDTVQSQG